MLRRNTPPWPHFLRREGNAAGAARTTWRASDEPPVRTGWENRQNWKYDGKYSGASEECALNASDSPGRAVCVISWRLQPAGWFVSARSRARRASGPATSLVTCSHATRRDTLLAGKGGQTDAFLLRVSPLTSVRSCLIPSMMADTELGSDRSIRRAPRIIHGTHRDARKLGSSERRERLGT